MDSQGQPQPAISPTAIDLLWGGALTAVLAAGLAPLVSADWRFFTLAAVLFGGIALAVITRWPVNRDFGWANRATLLRGSLVVVLVAAAPFADQLGGWLWGYLTLALVALILDGVDGKLARLTNSHSDFGARFDMELDALFILGLCVATLAAGKAGAWVVALGLMRYLFMATAWGLPWLGRPLPDSFRRKTICVWQIVTLMVALLPPIPDSFASGALATALVLLAWSFSLDIRWLYQRRHTHEPSHLHP